MSEQSRQLQGLSFLSTIMKIDPAFMDHLKSTEEMVYADGAVPRKMKLLIAMAFDATHGAVNGVRSLALSALEAGATRQEIAEVLRVACYLGGVGSVYAASTALKDVLP